MTEVLKKSEAEEYEVIEQSGIKPASSMVSMENLPESGASCPVCACSLDDGSKLHICTLCFTPHHKDCWDYTGGCAIFGCRKGAIRSCEAQVGISEENQFSAQSITPVTSVDTALMWVWGRVLYTQWIACLFAHYGVVAVGLTFSLSFSCGLLSVVFPLYAAFITSVIGLSGFFYLSLIISGIISLGVFGYIACLIPDFAMQLHFGMINVAGTTCKMEAAKSMANRIDLPPYLVTFARFLHQVAKSLSYLSLFLALVSFIVVILGYTSVSITLSSLITLSIAPIVTLIILSLLPTIKGDMNRRLSFVSTVQNRLIASAKDSHR